MDAAEERDDRAAHHDVVEVGHNEVRVVQVQVGGEGRQGETCEPADGEGEEEHQPVAHRGVEDDRALVEGGDPVEHLDRGRDRDEEGQAREEDRSKLTHRGEDVVPPDEERHAGDTQRGERDGAVAEDVLACVHGQQL